MTKRANRPSNKRSKKKIPGRTDIFNLAFLCKVLGTVIILFSLVISLATLFGIVGVVVGVMFVVLGVGLGRFRMWAWYLGVAVLVPINIIGGVAGLLLLGMGGISIVAISMILSAFYVSWVLLSKGGRARYKKISEAQTYIKNNPDSRHGRISARRSRK